MNKNQKLGKIWSTVGKGHRHLPRTPAVVKNEKYLRESLTSAGLSMDDIGCVLDWGPGGGWLTKICNPKKSIMFDIVPGYEKRIKEVLRDSRAELEFHLLSESEFPDIGTAPNVDLAILYSVIYHMPSASYVSDVVDYLLKISPKNIAIRNIFTDKPSWDRSLASYTNRNYLRGNIFNKSEFLKRFTDAGYTVKYDKVDREVWRSSAHGIDRSRKAYSCVLVISKEEKPAE